MTAPTTQAVQKPDKEKFDAELWAELYTLREAVKGPEGYTSWQDAAVDERMKRHAAERTCAAHEAEVGRLRIDAERYRFLQGATESQVWQFFNRSETDEHLNKMIDEARAALTQGETK
jgi:hypothetical protein